MGVKVLRAGDMLAEKNRLVRSYSKYFRLLRKRKNEQKKTWNRKIPSLSFWLREPDLNRRPPGYENWIRSANCLGKRSQSKSASSPSPTNCRRNTPKHLCLSLRLQPSQQPTSQSSSKFLGKSPKNGKSVGKTHCLKSPRQRSKNHGSQLKNPQFPKICAQIIKEKFASLTLAEHFFPGKRKRRSLKLSLLSCPSKSTPANRTGVLCLSVLLVFRILYQIIDV